MLVDFRNGMHARKEKFPCLCFVAEQTGSSVAMAATGTPPSVNLKYSTDLDEWLDFTPGTTTVSLPTPGSKIWMKAGNGGNSTFSSGGSVYWRFSISGKVAAYGSIMSLLDPLDQLRELNNDSNQFCFNHLFYNCAALTNPPELPATALSYSCYTYMFSGCTSLKTAPSLPALTITQNCYAYMFDGCISLTNAPELPAISCSSDATGAYRLMFNGCTSLSAAPSILPLTRGNCASVYDRMFINCTSLSVAPPMMLSSITSNSGGWDL